MALKRAVSAVSEECLILLGGLFGEEDGLNVGQNSSLSDSNPTKQFVQLFVVSDGELEVARDDSGLFVVPGGVSGQFEDFGGKILHDGGEIDRSTGTNPGGVVSTSQMAVDTADRELETSPDRPSLLRLLRLALSLS